MKLLGIFTVLLLTPAAALHADDDSALTLHLPGGKVETLSRFEELPKAVAKITEAGDFRLVVKGRHKLGAAVHFCLQPKQRLVIEGTGPEAVLDLGEVPAKEAALCLEGGQFELRGFTLRNGPAWTVQISQGVRYQLEHLRILDARGGGIVVWGPGGVDEPGPPGNRIEHCAIENFNTLKAKWTSDGMSVRDSQAIIARNVVRDCATETMGIRVMGAGNRIEGNLVQNVATGDAGGIYLWAGDSIYTAVGNVVRHNIVVGAARGIYLDDGFCAARVEQNYLIDCSTAAIFIGGGRDHVVRENVALRCPILAHIDNRRTGWRDLPQTAAVFSKARARLDKALRDETLRARIAAGGLDVKAFETLSETAYNQPEGNRVVGNVLMPPALEIRWQNYAKPNDALTGKATDPKLPNRMRPAPATKWNQLSAKDFDISGMPSVADLLNAVKGSKVIQIEERGDKIPNEIQQAEKTLTKWVDGFTDQTLERVRKSLGAPAKETTWLNEEKKELLLKYNIGVSTDLSLYFANGRVVKASLHLLP